MFQNISLNGNQLNASYISSISMMNLISSHIALINITAVNNTGPMMIISDSPGHISSSTWQDNSGREAMLSAYSQIEIIDSVFEGNYDANFGEAKLNLLSIMNNSSVTFSNNNFTSNKASLIQLSGDMNLPTSLKDLVLDKPSVDILTKPLLNISYCRFQDNVILEISQLISVTHAVMNWRDSIVINNAMLSDARTIDAGIGIVQGTQAIIAFDDCNITNNYGGIPLLYLGLSLVNISNCLFKNNNATNYAGVICIVVNSPLKIENNF